MLWHTAGAGGEAELPGVTKGRWFRYISDSETHGTPGAGHLVAPIAFLPNPEQLC